APVIKAVGILNETINFNYFIYINNTCLILNLPRVISRKTQKQDEVMYIIFSLLTVTIKSSYP
ncbi:hypothetical protein CEN42_17955, partial [Fischerella thermalis CCMEE 5208]